ncbi:hypothetical protein LUD75_03430 [Epilithonimonas sp. JDS]|uniref:hypothetical protein n=1 Tax=Epilithonimonas sp. JDS TaxID=2902797 RepID=UPI001E4383F0|nr:hypothetical protein [Epilithonimonas sp. JDS]MCD9853738.1 hypothetical protein [Epilithonimonas sp. JDS]
MPVAVAMPLIGMAVSTGMSGLQMAKANKEKKTIRNDINSFKRQDLVNPANGLQVSTLGADRQREDIARTMATYGNLAAMGGSRSIAGLLPSLMTQQNTQEAQIASSLDEQQKQIDQMRANGQLKIQDMQEQRENADLAGLGTQLDLANAEFANAKNQMIGGIVSGVANVASAGFESMQNGNGFFGGGDNPFKDAQITGQVLPGADVTKINGVLGGQKLPNSVSVFPQQKDVNVFKNSFYKSPFWAMGLGGNYFGGLK